MTIFISHSSTDNAEALALSDWMVAQGWDDLFLDIDPSAGSPRVSAGYGRCRSPASCRASRVIRDRGSCSNLSGPKEPQSPARPA